MRSRRRARCRNLPAVAKFTRELDSLVEEGRFEPSVPLEEIRLFSEYESLGGYQRGSPAVGGPRVRIHLPPAESPVRTRLAAQLPPTPAHPLEAVTYDNLLCSDEISLYRQ
jgi:hypothetical protein